ncbi:hypothetical protein NE237_007377 [Protea cynaroides]|uniref:Uncharacterized protein n=1 Tax=Protea cynaroides TaxID=273540 RepID=A0A9Q0QW65_9MAGN|nr:hypothetical protein NE237_007377 [Protea cynaroides]
MLDVSRARHDLLISYLSPSPRAVSTDYTVAQCITVLEGMPDLDKDLYMKAVMKMVDNPQWREDGHQMGHYVCDCGNLHTLRKLLLCQISISGAHLEDLILQVDEEELFIIFGSFMGNPMQGAMDCLERSKCFFHGSIRDLLPASCFHKVSSTQLLLPHFSCHLSSYLLLVSVRQSVACKQRR